MYHFNLDITYEGLNIEVEGEYESFARPTLTEPGEGGIYDLGIYIDCVEISGWLNTETYDDIAKVVWNVLKG